MNTFENTRIWKEGLDKVELMIEDQPIPVVLLANKVSGICVLPLRCTHIHNCGFVVRSYGREKA